MELYLKPDIFAVDYEKALVEIARFKPRRILVQAPEGLLTYTLKLADLIEEKIGCEVYISADPCFGACMLPYRASDEVGCDLIVHVGHTPIPGLERKPVVYVDVASRVEVKPVVLEATEKLRGYRRVGLVTNVHHVDRLDEIKRVLEEAGKNVYIGKPRFRAVYPGQILGCDISAAEDVADKVEVFLYVGGGFFHPLGVALATGKPVVAADPFTGLVSDLENVKRRFLRKRYANIVRASEAKVFAVMVGLEPGQMNVERAKELASKIRASGRKAYLLTLYVFNPEFVSSFREVEAFVNTACPRLAVEDSFVFDKPILNPEELLVVLGEKRWDELVKDP